MDIERHMLQKLSQEKKDTLLDDERCHHTVRGMCFCIIVHCHIYEYWCHHSEPLRTYSYMKCGSAFLIMVLESWIYVILIPLYKPPACMTGNILGTTSESEYFMIRIWTNNSAFQRISGTKIIKKIFVDTNF